MSYFLLERGNKEETLALTMENAKGQLTILLIITEELTQMSIVK